MAEQKQFTVEEVLRMTVNMLGGILVPASLSEQIARPIFESIRNIQLCINTFEKADAEAQEEPKDDA